MTIHIEYCIKFKIYCRRNWYTALWRRYSQRVTRIFHRKISCYWRNDSRWFREWAPEGAAKSVVRSSTRVQRHVPSETLLTSSCNYTMMIVRLIPDAFPLRVGARLYSNPQGRYRAAHEMLRVGPVGKKSIGECTCVPLIVTKAGTERFCFPVNLRPINSQTAIQSCQ